MSEAPVWHGVGRSKSPALRSVGSAARIGVKGDAKAGRAGGRKADPAAMGGQQVRTTARPMPVPPDDRRVEKPARTPSAAASGGCKTLIRILGKAVEKTLAEVRN